MASSTGSDGTKIIAVIRSPLSGLIHRSTNSGATWTAQTDSSVKRNWQSVASSSDGTKLVAVESNGLIYGSSDSGATWTAQTSAGGRNWYSVASSEDGNKIDAVVQNGEIWTYYLNLVYS